MRRHAPTILAAALSVIGLAACPTGEGQGSAVGRLYILGCDGVDDYGSAAQPGGYDLGARFFVGEPILDDGGGTAPLNRLDIRIQKSGNPLNDADHLFLQIRDVRLAAELVAQGEGVPVDLDGNVQAKLSLWLTCPSYFGSLAAVTPAAGAACPAVDLPQLCADVDYQERPTLGAAFPPFDTAAGHSCVFFCRFGSVDPLAGPPPTIDIDFKIAFGERVQGIYMLTLGEQRMLAANPGAEVCEDAIDNDGDGAIDEVDCVTTTGFGVVFGRFNFEIRRGQVAQEFP